MAQTVNYVRCLNCSWTGPSSQLEFWFAKIKVSVMLPGMVEPGRIVAGACPKCGEFHFDDATTDEWFEYTDKELGHGSDKA